MDNKKINAKHKNSSYLKNNQKTTGQPPLQSTTSIDELKKKFANGELPTQDDFAAIFDSYFHKDIKIPEEDIDGLINDLNSKEDIADAEAKFKDLDNKKENKTDADKAFNDLNTAVNNLKDSKEDKTEAEAKFKDLDDRKENKADADKAFNNLNTAVEDLKKIKEDKTEANQKFGDLNTAVKNLQDSKEDKADMVNYLQISPDDLQDNDIAIREGGKWIRKQASEVSTIKPLTLQQNGQPIGRFDGKVEQTLNIDAPKIKDVTGANINVFTKNDNISINQLFDLYINQISGSNIVKGSFSYADNYTLETPYNNVSLACVTSLITGYSVNKDGAQALIMCGANIAAPNQLSNELLMYDGRPEGYTSGWTRMLNDHNFNEYVPKKDGTGATGTWNINILGGSAEAAHAGNAETAQSLNSFYIGGLVPPAGFKGKGLALNMSYIWPDRGTLGYGDLLYLNGYANVAEDVPWCNAILCQKTSAVHGDVYHATGLTDTGDKWNTWHKFIDDFNINDYLKKYVKIAGGTMTGPLTLSDGNIDVQNGQISASGGFFESSDVTLKTNVQDIDLKVAKNLRFVEFDRIDTKRHGYGVIAQEVEQLYPTVVTTDKQSGIKQVNYNEVYAIKLAYLEQELAELRKEIKELKQVKK